MDLATYYRTARRTRWSQLLWRARYRLERGWRPGTGHARWRWTGERAPRLRTDFPDVPLFHRGVPEGLAGVAVLGQGVFSHLNQSRALGCEETDWRLGPVAAERLWTVTLHYHGWAYDLAEAAAAAGPGADQAA